MTHTRAGRRLVAAILLLAGVVVSATACTPDTTRGRVQSDFAATFAHSYVTSEALAGQPTEPPKISSNECHSGINKKADAGPGSWSCEITYTDSQGKAHDDFFVVLIDALGCYQAFNGDNRDATILDRSTHVRIPDPKVGFDGCFDVYDNKTNTSKS